jgi:DnaJ family protein C protein 7
LQRTKTAGNDAFKAGRWQEAYDLYTESLAIDPDNKHINAALFFNRATTCSKLNRLEDCVTDCTRAIELDDGYIKAYARRAKAYMDKEDYEAAVIDYEKLNKLEKTRGWSALLSFWG